MTQDEYKNLLISISLDRIDVFLADLELDYPDHCIEKRTNKRVRVAVHVAEQLLNQVDDVLKRKKRTEEVRDKMNYILENH